MLREAQSQYIGKNVSLLITRLKNSGDYSEINIYLPNELSKNILAVNQIIIFENMEYLVNYKSVIIDVRLNGANPYRSEGAELERYLLDSIVESTDTQSIDPE